MPPQLSVIIPVYNEAATLEPLLSKLEQVLNGISHEILVVDDGSTDGTTEFVKQLSRCPFTTLFHTKNRGKGAALRTAVEYVTGDIIIIQDADLEYDPKDIPSLIQPILDGSADAVFGSRFHGQSQCVHLYWHRVANRWLTWLTNLLFTLKLSDMETGYKAFRRSALDNIVLREDRFGIEPELTAKLAKRRYRITEVPISYCGRDYSHGKKIGFRDALWAAWSIARYRNWD